MHDCIVKLLKNHDEESLECLCRLLSTIGKDLDFEKAKVYWTHLTDTEAERKCVTHLNARTQLETSCEIKLCKLYCPKRITHQVVVSVLSLAWTSILIRWRKS